MNKIILTGNLGKDAESKQANGRTVINFSIGVSEKLKDGTSKSMWFEIAYWSEKVGILPYLKKGTKVLIDGKLEEPRIHNDKAYLKVTAWTIELIGSQQAAGQTQSTPPISQQQQQDTPTTPGHIADPEGVDDLPF